MGILKDLRHKEIISTAQINDLIVGLIAEINEYLLAKEAVQINIGGEKTLF